MRAWLVILAVAFALEQGCLYWLYYHAGAKPLLGDEVRYLETARGILAGGPWHPSQIWPPAQPLFIAPLLRIAGGSLWLVQALQSLLLIGCAVLLLRLWRQLTGDRLAAAIAASLFLLNPSTGAYAQYLWPEATHLFAMLLALSLLLPRRPGIGAAALAGVALGAALLFKSLLSGYWPLLLLCFVGRQPRLDWKPAAAFLLALCVVVAPALLEGHRNSGHWRIADSSMFNLLAGLHDRARNDYVDEPVGPLFEQYLASGKNAQERDAWAREVISDRLQEQTLEQTLTVQLSRQYFRLFENKTLLLTQLQGPRCAGYLGIYPPAPEALVTGIKWTSSLFHIITLVGFAFGLCLWRDWRKPWPWLLLALIGYQLALYLGLHVKARYLLPMLPILCGFAGSALACCVAPNANLRISAARLTLATLFALLLAFLAFAGPWLDGYCS